MTPAEWIVYQNQGATRSQPLDPALVEAFGFLPAMGLCAIRAAGPLMPPAR